MAKTPIKQRKEPKQARSKATVNAILEAAAHILVKDGYGAFNTNHVAQKAGVSIGSLYQYFPNKESLIAALSLSHVTQIRDSLSDIEFSPDMKLETFVQLVVKNHIKLHRINPKLHHILTKEVSAYGALNHQQVLSDEIQEKLYWMMKYHTETAKLKNPQLILFMIMNSVEAITHTAMSSKMEYLDSPLFEAELVRLVLGFLSEAERDPTNTEPFIPPENPVTKNSK